MDSNSIVIVHLVKRIFRSEGIGIFPSLSDTFLTRVGTTIVDVLE